VIRRLGRVAWRALDRFFAHHGPDRAAAVAYYTLLSLLPLVIFVVSVGVAFYGSFDAAYQGSLILFGGLVVHLDQHDLDAVRSFVERSVRFRWPGVLLLAWTSKRVFSSLLSAMEAVFEVPPRGFARGNLMSLAMVLITSIGLLATLALTLFVAAAEGLLMRYAPFGAGALHSLTVLLLTRGLPAFITLGFFFIVYRVVPHRVMRARYALAGAVLATVLWEAAKAGFAYYVTNLAHYAGLYGAFEGIIVLALWLELSASIALYSGEVVALLIPAGPGTQAGKG
jgi:membrane protein